MHSPARTGFSAAAGKDFERLAMNFLTAPFATINRYRTILLRTTYNELRSTYAGSALGMAWVVLGPMMLLSVYALVYAVIFRVRPTDMTVTEYILYVFSGLVPFIAFATAMTQGALSLTANKQVLLNTVFPAELVPLRSVLVASASLPAGIVILFVGDLLFSRLTPTFLLVPVVVVLQIMFLAGLSWMLSLLTLLIRDIQQVLTYITMLLLVITPIAYTPDMIPPQLKILMYLNPLYYFVTSYQSLILLNKLPPLDVIVIGTFISVAMFCSGFVMCRRAKQVFYDFA